MSSRRHRWAALSLLALVGLSTGARAAPAEKLALWLDGRAAAALHSTIAAAAAGRHLLAPALVAREAKHAHGAAALAARLHASVLYAHVEASGAVTLTLAAHGEPAVTRVVARNDVAAAVRELLHGATPPPATTSEPLAATSPSSRAAPPSSRAASPPPSSRAASPSPSPSSPTSDETTLVARAPAAAPPDSLFSIALDGGIGARRLQYNQPITQNLPSYSVAAVPWLGFRAAVHPFARTTVPFVRGLGAFGDFGHSLYQQSVIAGGGPRVSADWMSYDVGLHERIRIGDSRFAPTVGVALAYGRVAYNFEDGGQLISDTPSVDYRYLRPAIDAHVTFGRVALFVDGGYRAILSAGYVGSRFPRAQVGGVDVAAGLAVALPHDLALRLTGQYVRFFYDFRPQPGDAYIAGGAVDEFAVGELALAYGF